MEILRSVYTHLDLNQKVLGELKTISIKFAFIHLFYIQFEKVFQYVTIVNGNEDENLTDYYKSMKAVAWLLFVINRGKDNRLPKNANMMLCSLSYMLKNSSKLLTIEFVISEKGEKAVIPGEKKYNLQGQILEYLCKLMHFNCDEETQMIKEEIDKKIEALFCDNFGFDNPGIYDHLSNKKKINIVIKLLETYYRKNLSDEDVDESIFVRESRVTNSLTN